jgi:hypothetical protein
MKSNLTIEQVEKILSQYGIEKKQLDSVCTEYRLKNYKVQSPVVQYFHLSNGETAFAFKGLLHKYPCSQFLAKLVKNNQSEKFYWGMAEGTNAIGLKPDTIFANETNLNAAMLVLIGELEKNELRR